MNISDKPLVFWSWNDALEIPELLRQLREFRAAGVGGCFLHARAGLRTPYLGREWMDCCRAVCEEAKKLKLDIYLTMRMVGRAALPAASYRIRGKIIARSTFILPILIPTKTHQNNIC